MRAFRSPAALLVTVLVIACTDAPTSLPSDVGALAERLSSLSART